MPNTTQEYGKVIPLFNTPQSYIKPVPLKKPTLDDVLDDFDKDINTRHDAEPFKDIEDINRILTHFLTQHNKSWNTAQRQPSRKWNPRYLRNYILLQIGCNVGVRCSDLVKLQIGHFIDPQGNYRDVTEILEQKTLNTRRAKKPRMIDINDCIKSAIEIHKKFNSDWTRQDYLFPGDYDDNNIPVKGHMTVRGVDHIIRGITKKLSIQGRYATHSMRKFFGYQFMLQNGNNEESLLMLQVLYGHSSPKITSSYIGITRGKIRNACLNMHTGFTTDDLKNKGLI